MALLKEVKMEGGIQGMVIVFSACMIQVLAFGNYACVGIYTLYLVEEFPEDTVGVSLVSSIHFALLLGCGPLISFLMTKVSYRKLSILGALLVFVGILCTPLLIHLPALYLFFGVFAGLGGCFIYLPSHVLSGLYYDKYRSLSTGVATSGTGLSATLMPLIVSNLIEEYSWKGSLLILAGLDFHLLIFALLMLPPPTPPSVTKCTKDDDYRMSELHSQKDLSNDKAVILSGADQSGASTLYEPLTNDTGYNYDYSEKTEENHRLLLSIAEDEQCNFEINHQESSHHSNNKKNEENSVKQKLRAYNSVPDDDISMVFQPSYLSWATNLSVRGSRLYDSFPSFLHETDIGNHSENNFPVSNKFNGKLTQKMQINPETIKHKTLKETLKHHFLLFINFKFLIYFISTILWSLSTIIFITFGPELFVLKGLSKYDAAIVFTFFGVGQLLGCIFISILGSCVGKRVFLYILSNSLTGFFIGIAPLYDSYAWIVMVCLCSGGAYGGILGLYMIVMVDIVGVDDMEIGLGYIMLASGIGCFAGPPLGAHLKDIYYDYNYSFYLAGVFAVIAGLCMVFIYLKCCKEKELKEEYV